jgi:transposase
MVRHPPELREKAVRMVRQLRKETGKKKGAVQRVAEQLDIGPESLWHWARQDEIDNGEAVGTTTEDGVRIRALEQENRELRRANAILKSASALFAAELDRPQR